MIEPRKTVVAEFVRLMVGWRWQASQAAVRGEQEGKGRKRHKQTGRMQDARC